MKVLAQAKERACNKNVLHDKSVAAFGVALRNLIQSFVGKRRRYRTKAKASLRRWYAVRIFIRIQRMTDNDKPLE